MIVLNALKRWWSKRQLKDSRYDFLFAESADTDVVCFDCETTGLNPKVDKIISLSAIKIRDNQILTSESLNLRFAQQQTINPNSIVIHRLRNVDVEAGLDEQDAIDQFLRFVGSRPLIGYYLEFDVAMVDQVIKPWLGIHLPNKKIEVSKLYHQRYYQPWLQQEHEVLDLSFGAILNRLDLPEMEQHDAFNDALMTSLIYVKLRQLHAGKKD